jgi:hypothetical protein
VTACPCSTCAPLRALQRAAARWKALAKHKRRIVGMLDEEIANSYESESEAKNKVYALRVENARLRKELERLARRNQLGDDLLADRDGYAEDEWQGLYLDTIRIARAALADGEKEGSDG